MMAAKDVTYVCISTSNHINTFSNKDTLGQSQWHTNYDQCRQCLSMHEVPYDVKFDGKILTFILMSIFCYQIKIITLVIFHC